MTLAYQTGGRWFKSAARLSQKGFEYVTMNPVILAKAVGPQPAVSRSIIAADESVGMFEV